MHCPQCGQQQASASLRFCARCGFPLEGVLQLLANGGMMPASSSTGGPKEMSPRRKGVRQGAILMLAGVVVVPVLGVLNSFSDGNALTLLTALAAIVFFVGGLIRMLFAALFEEGATYNQAMPPTYVSPPMPAQLNTPIRGSALPPVPANPAAGWRQRPSTAEIFNPPSITENTTRLLDKDDPNKH